MITNHHTHESRWVPIAGVAINLLVLTDCSVRATLGRSFPCSTIIPSHFGVVGAATPALAGPLLRREVVQRSGWTPAGLEGRQASLGKWLRRRPGCLQTMDPPVVRPLTWGTCNGDHLDPQMNAADYVVSLGESD